MMDMLQDIGKNLPYNEPEEYLDGLIDQVTEDTVKQQGLRRIDHPILKMVASAAAVVLLVVGIALIRFNQDGKRGFITMQAEAPIDEFLSTLTDEEVAQLPYYEIEEIPEY
jgi:hypothetical protein